MAGASLQNIYGRVGSDTSHNPSSANLFSDATLEGGDVVQIKRGDKTYNVQAHKLQTVWKGSGFQQHVESTGNRERTSIARMSAKKYAKGGSGLRNDQGFRNYVYDAYNNLRSGIEQTESSIMLFVQDQYARLRSGIDITESSLYLYVDNKYSQIRSGIEMTESSLMLYVDNKYNQMKSGIDITESSLYLYVDNKYSQIKSGIEMTDSSLHLYVDNKYNQMKSGIELTDSSLHAYVDSKYNQMKSGIEVTASSARLYTESKTSRAYIMTRINANGEGEALIDADKVSITGNTTLSGTMSIDGSGQLCVSRVIAVGTTGNLTTINGNKITSGTYQVNSGGKIVFVGTGSGEHYDIDVATLKNCIKSASVSGSTLTLTPFYGNAITFNKAVTLQGTWSNGVYTVSATSGVINGSAPSTQLRYANPTGTVSRNGKVVSRVFNIQYGPDDDHLYNTGFSPTISIDASSVYTAGQSDVTLNDPVWAYDGDNVSTNNRSSNTVTVTTNGRATQLSKSVTITLRQEGSWNGKTKYAYVTRGTSSGGEYVARLQIDASSVYNSGWSAAKNSVVNKTYTVSGNTYYYNPTSTVSSSIRLQYMRVATPNTTVDGSALSTLYYVTSDDNVAYIRYGSASGAIVAQVTHNKYTNGFNAARISGSWNGNTYTGKISTSGGTTTTITVTAGVSISYNSSAHTYTATATASSNSTTRQTKTTTSGTEAYDSGYSSGYSSGDTAGYNRGYDTGYNAGYNSGYSAGYSAGGGGGVSSSNIRISAPPTVQYGRPSGTELSTWRNPVNNALSNRCYLVFDVWLTTNTNDKKRYYINFE